MHYLSRQASGVNEIINFKGESSGAAPDDAAIAALILAVGQRVRRARERKGISRRVLSEKSGVSQRYLAQLEMGGGNISIGLLHKVATALDHRIEWLVGLEDPWTSEPMRVAELYRAATAETRQGVLRLLEPEAPERLRANRICLIGLRGAGKSSLGQRAGAALDVPFLELNREIEEQSGMPVEDVMALYGQEGYRRLEHQALSRTIAAHDVLILAVAGGIVAEPETFALLLRRFHTIWLRASPEEHMARVRAQGDERPMAGNPKAMEELRSILTSRETLYARADAVLDTSGLDRDAALARLVAIIRDRGYLA